MRIHFNISPVAAQQAIQRATGAAGVWRERNDRHGSRSHTVAYDVILSGDSPHRINFSAEHGGEQAASWDQWGIFLAVIYAADPTAKSWAYEDAEDFHEKTGHRFDLDNADAITSTRSPGYQRTAHKWERIELVTGRTIWRCANTKHGDCASVRSFERAS